MTETPDNALGPLSEGVHGVPHAPRQETRKRCIAAICPCTAICVDLLGSDAAIQRRTSQPLQHGGRVGTYQSSALLRKRTWLRSDRLHGTPIGRVLAGHRVV